MKKNIKGNLNLKIRNIADEMINTIDYAAYLECDQNDISGAELEKRKILNLKNQLDNLLKNFLN